MPKQVEFDHRRQLWDQYRQFHMVYRSDGVVQFDTGELMVTRNIFDPGERGRVNKFGLMYIMPHDKNFPVHMIDKDNDIQLRRSWLHNGMYMVDMEAKSVTILSDCQRHDAGIPEHKARFTCYAYCGGHGRPWISGIKGISYTKPMPLTKEQKARMKDLRKLCMAADRLGVLPQDLWQVPESEWGSVSINAPVECTDALLLNFSDMTPVEKAIVARYGYAPPRMTITSNNVGVV